MQDCIYDLLNNMEQEVEQYDDENMSEIEVKQIMRAFKNQRKLQSGRKAGMKKYMVAAALAVVVGAGVVFYNPVMAQMHLATYHIQDFLGMNTDVSSYTTAVNQTVSKDGICVSLSEVIVDEQIIHVLYSVKNTNLPVEEIAYLTDVNAVISINGKNVMDGGHGGVTYVDGENVYMMALDVEKFDVEKDNYFQIIFYDSYENEIGKVSFIASGKDLIKNMDNQPINHQLELENGCVLDLDEIIVSPVQYRINLSLALGETKDMNYDVTLRGKDNLSRDMEFYMAKWDGDTGMMVLFYDEENIDMTEVTSFTVTPYAQVFPVQSGEMNTEIKQIGEEFTIQLNK